jgi:pSer/pThr/pTyr-binding forkhead associated (FHA) protein
MFLKYFDALAAPIRWWRSKVQKVRNVQGGIRHDINRVKSYKQIAKVRAVEAKQMAGKAKQKAQAAKGKIAAANQSAAQRMGGGPAPMAAGAAGGGMAYPAPAPMSGGMAYPGPPPGGPMAYQPPGHGPGPQLAPGPAPGYARPGGGPGAFAPPPGQMGGAGGFPGPSPGGSAPLSGSNGIVVTGALWWKKHWCPQCAQQLDKTWDRCPYCSGAAPIVASHKTQAIMVDAAGTGNGLQLCGWLVGLKGSQRGELFTLEPVTSVGSDPACTVVLNDSYMSSRHCEIRAEGGVWVLRDLKSTNGTYVNDKRVEQHELVDSDFVRLGQSVLKFKSL